MAASGAAFVTRPGPADQPSHGPWHLVVLEAAGLQPVPGSPVTLSGPVSALAVTQTVDRYHLGYADGIAVLDGAAFQPVPDSPVPLKGTFLIAAARDDSSLYAMSWPGSPHPSVLSRIDATTLKVQAQIPVDTFILHLAPIGTLTTSLDDGLLFVVSLSLWAYTRRHLPVSQLSVYDAATLEEVSWSPVDFGTLLPLDIAMSPDGSRLFALVGSEPGEQQQQPSLYLYAVDPEFSRGAASGS